MNKVMLVGRIVRDIEIRKGVGRISLAVDKNLSKEKRAEYEAQNKPTADFISVVLFGKNAELVQNYSGKGLRIAVEGHITTGSYEKGEQKIYTTDVNAERVEFIDWKNSNNGQTPAQGQAPAQPNNVPSYNDAMFDAPSNIDW